MEQKKLDRINELAKKKKEGTLTEEEAAERKALHEEYILEFRRSFGAILDNTVIQYPDGSRKVLKKDNEENENNSQKISADKAEIFCYKYVK